MYSNDCCKVKIGHRLSQVIYPNQGVRQGCVLSPLLFNLFLADLPSIFQGPEFHAPKITNSISMNCILWADDIILLSESEEGLQNMLTKISHYNKQNSMEVNLDKTKSMIFNKTGRLMKRYFKYRGSNIESVREYKYLGFLLTPSGEISSGLKDLKDRATRATAHLRANMGIFFQKHVPTTLKLFDSIIKPILMYMSDFWGSLKMPKSNPIDLMQNKFLKQVLGVQIQKTNNGVILEMGSVPLSIYGKRACTKNWARVVRKQCNKLVHMSYENAFSNSLVWPCMVRLNFERVGLYDLFLNPRDKNVEIELFQRLTDIYHQETFDKMRENSSKLRTYGLMKHAIGIEDYLQKDMHFRKALTKLRLSNHNLRIEKGRHEKIDKKERFCTFCANKIEDEKHFLMSCTTYKNQRGDLMDVANRIVNRFSSLDIQEKFITILTNPDLALYTARYIYQCFELRDFLIRRAKNNA